MTNLKQLTKFVNEELPAFVDHKENPDEWYVLIGNMTGEYSVWADEELPEDYEAIQQEMPPEDRDANPNVEGYMQAGSSGWLAECFDFKDSDSKGFVDEYAWGDNIDKRLMNIIVVHESVLSDMALEVANGENEPVSPKK